MKRRPLFSRLVKSMDFLRAGHVLTLIARRGISEAAVDRLRTRKHRALMSALSALLKDWGMELRREVERKRLGVGWKVGWNDMTERSMRMKIMQKRMEGVI